MKCNYCKRKAIVNYQKIWEKFDLVYSKKNGYEEYKQDTSIHPLDIEAPTGKDNLHLCKIHEQQFRNGEI